MVNSLSKRDPYLDFLRAVGLLLLIAVHVNPPKWFVPMRSFDVPLMIFVSALCYKALGGGYLSYVKKRIERIYIPVFVFLTIFFVVAFLCPVFAEEINLNRNKVLGSYLLLNNPSIGYVWIMRVFLMMASILPILYDFFDSKGYLFIVVSIFAIIIIQSFLIVFVNMVDNRIVQFILDETVLYFFGYSCIAILGLKIRNFNRKGCALFILLTGGCIIGIVAWHNWNFNPQNYKYPPHLLYLFYGLFGSAFLWYLKPILYPVIKRVSFFSYMSKNSMWIYLWHIIPAYFVSMLLDRPNLWIGRYLLVLIFAILLNWVYQRIIKYLPASIYNAVK